MRDAGNLGHSSFSQARPKPIAVGIRLLSLAGVIGTLACAPAALADTTTSSNWAGYAVHGRNVSFRSVQAAWTQPKVTCTPGVPTYSSFWIGIGGYSVTSPALEQIGTEVDCTRSGQVSSTAWYELVPAASMPINLTVHPGDAIIASVSVKKHKVGVALYDATTKQGFSKTLTASIVDVSSADWIVEAPSECIGNGACQTLALADFGSATFSAAAAETVSGDTGTISDPAWQATKIKLAPQGQRFVLNGGAAAPLGLATPSPLGPGGSVFNVSYSQLKASGAPLGGTPVESTEARLSSALPVSRLVHRGR